MCKLRKEKGGLCFWLSRVFPVPLLSHPPSPLCIFVCVCLRGCSFLPSCTWAINYNHHKLSSSADKYENAGFPRCSTCSSNSLGCSVLFTPVYLSSVVLSSATLLDRPGAFPQPESTSWPPANAHPTSTTHSKQKPQ